MLLFRHVVIRSQAACAAFFNAISSNGLHGKDFVRHVRSLGVTLDPEQPGCLQSLSFARVAALLPGLTTFGLACYSHSKTMNSYQRDTEPFLILRDEEVSILRAGPVITTLRLTNWSADRSLFNKLLELYHPSLRTLSLRGAPSSFPLLTTLVPTTPLQPLHLALEPPLAPALRDWLINPTNRPRVRAFEFTRRPEPAVLAALLTAHGNTLTALALPTLTAADAGLVASLQRTPAPASSCSARNTRTLRSRWDARIYVMRRSLRAQRLSSSAGRCARTRPLRTILMAAPEPEPKPEPLAGG